MKILITENQCKNILIEQSRHDYLKWKRKNVTLRGIAELGKENKGGGRFGSGLYTAFLSNKNMSKIYGKVYFVLNAIPKTPKVLQDANLAEMFLQGIINNWCKSRGMSYNSNEFFKHTDIRTEMLNLGYDGLVIKGREMVNYTPPDNVKYFEHEFQLENYYHQLPNQLNENTNIKNEIIFIRTKKFNNEETINKLPYDGIQCWCIFKNDFDKYITELELWGGNKKDVEIIPSDGFNIFALYYPLAHKYVMGETDKVPELEPFNVHKHRMKFIKQGEKSMLDYVADMKYQILLTNQLNEDYNFNMGDCDIYAVALHRLYGYPLYVIRGYFLEPEWGGKREWDYEDCHIAVRLPNGLFKDSNGEYTLEELKPLSMFGNDVKKIKAVKIDEEQALSTFSFQNQEEHVQKVMDIINKI